MSNGMDGKRHSHLRLKRLGIDTYRQHVIYMSRDCHLCRSEGFEVRSRVAVSLAGQVWPVPSFGSSTNSMQILAVRAGGPRNRDALILTFYHRTALTVSGNSREPGVVICGPISQGIDYLRKRGTR